MKELSKIGLIFLSVVLLTGLVAGSGSAFYQDSSSGSINAVLSDGTSIDLGVSASILGEPANLDSDSYVEVPYVDGSGNLKIVDKNGEVQNLDSGISTSNVVIGTGKWKGSKAYVFYPDAQNSSYIMRNRAGFTAETVGSGISSNGVIGTGDFNGDGDKDLVFLGTSDTVKYRDGGSTSSTGFSSFGSNSNKGVGGLTDFDNDGVARVPYVTGSNGISLLDYQGNKVQPNSNFANALKTNIGGVDIAGDSKKEILYVNKNNKVGYMFLNGTTGVINVGAVGSVGVSGGDNIFNQAPDKPTVSAPSDGSTITDSTPKLEVSVSDPEMDKMDVTFYLDGSKVNTNTGVSNGKTSYTTSSLSDGTYNWYVKASDGSNTTTSKTWSFTVDSSGGGGGSGGSSGGGGFSEGDRYSEYEWSVSLKQDNSEEIVRFDSDNDGYFKRKIVVETNDAVPNIRLNCKSSGNECSWLNSTEGTIDLGIEDRKVVTIEGEIPRNIEGEKSFSITFTPTTYERNNDVQKKSIEFTVKTKDKLNNLVSFLSGLFLSMVFFIPVWISGKHRDYPLGVGLVTFLIFIVTVATFTVF